jgi:hypothetical protein
LLKGHADLLGKIALAHSAIGSKDANLRSHHNVEWVWTLAQHQDAPEPIVADTRHNYRRHQS